MPIRGVKNPFPKIMPATNGGLFSANGSQKKDPVKLPSISTKTMAEAMKSNRKKG